ncbi:MAG: acetyltransferase [Deltaproteobacteria bacterium]|nr:acetyltransferase [Deltaproteobacteria bacterium]
MNKKIIIIGAGGHAKVALAALLECQATVMGLTENDPRKHGMEILGCRVIGNDAVITNHDPQEVLLVNGVGSTKDNTPRKKIFKTFKALGFTFINVIHPAAFCSRGVILSEGVQIHAGAVLQPGVTIGENTIINTGARIDHDCLIGAHAHIAPGAVLCGDVRVAEGAFIGSGACVIQGVKIGRGSIVGAGCTALKDVGPGETFVGR